MPYPWGANGDTDHSKPPSKCQLHGKITCVLGTPLRPASLEPVKYRQKAHDRQYDSVWQRHPEHAPIGQSDQGRKRGREQEKECGLAIRGGDAWDVRSGVDGDGQRIELLARNGPFE